VTGGGRAAARLPRPSTTAHRDEADVEAALSAADPELARLIDAVISRVGRLQLTPSQASPFEALLRAIVYQQMAAKAAASVYKNLQASVSGALTPQQVLSLSPERLRAAGLSAAKAKYARNLADWFTRNPKTAKSLPALSNGEVIEALTTIPGIGIWTANVFLIFSLGRLDVVPASDLGIRRGVQLAYGLASLATLEMVKEKARRWRPYQIIASMYLWNAVKLKIGPDVLR
jgi:3-methyladenine DNA glycosylase/8-oxoguanine DNA glycosylase